MEKISTGKDGQNHLRKEEWRLHHKSRKVGKIIPEKKNDTTITKDEVWSKASQKLKQNYRHHLNEGYINKKNTTMNMKQSIEANTKWNMNMNMQVRMKIMIKMEMKMDMNMKINMNEKMNHYKFGHESHEACEEECGMLTRR
jgi:hypothetical protein